MNYKNERDKDIAVSGGESLNHFQSRLHRFKLIGLNRKSKTGIYATVQYGKEDWFHSDFDEKVFSVAQQYSLFDFFKNTEDNLWHNKNHAVVVEFDGYSTSGTPINPIVKEVFLDNITTCNK